MSSRVGNFSSSQIHMLMSKSRGNFSLENVGKPFHTYINQKYWERKFGRSLNKQISAKPTSWGTLVEQQCFNRLSLEYKLVSKTRYAHPKLSNYWTGMPDLLTDDLVGDIKSPYSLESFGAMLEAFESVEKFKADYPQYYWQLVSNAILCEKDKAVIIAYVPYQKHLEDIRELTMQVHESEQNKYAWINWAEDDELPYLPNDCGINDVNAFEFDVSQEDKDLLTARVEMAVEVLKRRLNGD